MWGNLTDTTVGGAGGFLNDSRGGASGGDKGDSKRGQNIVPVMIKHITRCTGDLDIWGIPIRIVTFVGIVRHIEQVTTRTSYEIEDETDKIVAFRWMEAKRNATEPMPEINTYVRVYGYLREQNEKKHVLILRLLPVRDLNELTNHLLEVTYVTLKAKKMQSIENEGLRDVNSDDVMLDESLIGLTKEQAVVFKIIRAENETENGIERNVLKARVPKNILPSVDDIIDFLTSEGHIYTTLTDDHFKTT